MTKKKTFRNAPSGGSGVQRSTTPPLPGFSAQSLPYNVWVRGRIEKFCATAAEAEAALRERLGEETKA